MLPTAEGEWGSVQWVREGGAEALEGVQAETAKAAAGAYSAAVEDSLDDNEAGLTVGQHLRRSWPKACFAARCPSWRAAHP